MSFLWEGRLQASLHSLAKTFTFSPETDLKLAKYDVTGSIAHTKMLMETGVLSRIDGRSILSGLNEILTEIKEGTFQLSEHDEDIHSSIERQLIERIGDAGAKLHTGRSRNDQIVLDEKLYLKEILPLLQGKIRLFQKSLVKKAEEYENAVMPECTHFQPSQPVLLAHHLLAWVEMLDRDRRRFGYALELADVSPLGAGSGTGSSFPLRPDITAKELGFHEIFSNSVDAVSDRDFIADTLVACASTMTHLSRFAEELILWSNPFIGFVSLPDEFCTGSSIMPQKKNPDVLELIRGKSARVIAAVSGIFTLMKGTALSYNRDFQEDKEYLFPSVETTALSLEIFAALFDSVTFDTNAMEKACEKGYLTATDIAENLTKQGIPFRKAHHAAGILVRRAIEKKSTLANLDPKEIHSLVPEISPEFIAELTAKKSVSLKASPGGTGPHHVAQGILQWKKRLQ